MGSADKLHAFLTSVLDGSKWSALRSGAKITVPSR